MWHQYRSPVPGRTPCSLENIPKPKGIMKTKKLSKKKSTKNQCLKTVKRGLIWEATQNPGVMCNTMLPPSCFTEICGQSPLRCGSLQLHFASWFMGKGSPSLLIFIAMCSCQKSWAFTYFLEDFVKCISVRKMWFYFRNANDLGLMIYLLANDSHASAQFIFFRGQKFLQISSHRQVKGKTTLCILERIRLSKRVAMAGWTSIPRLHLTPDISSVHCIKAYLNRERCWSLTAQTAFGSSSL